MKPLTATALGWLYQSNAVAYFFYALTLAMDKAEDSRADQVKSIMTDAEREIVRAAYKRSK